MPDKDNSTPTAAELRALLTSVYGILEHAYGLIKESDYAKDSTGQMIYCMVYHAMQLIVDFEN